MHVSLIFDDINSDIYSQYCRYVYDKFKDDLKSLVIRKSKSYKVRESKVKELLNLDYLVNLSECVLKSTEMINVNGVYVIRLNPRKRVHGIKVSTLVRLLEFGSLDLKELPILRRVMFKYNQCYKDYVGEFINKRVIL